MSSSASASSRSVSKSAQGFVGFEECDAEGRFILLENTHRAKDEAIGGWQVKRTIDSDKEVVFTFPDDFVLKGAHRVKIWSSNADNANNNPPDEITLPDGMSWEKGEHTRTQLLDKDGREKASYIKRVSSV